MKFELKQNNRNPKKEEALSDMKATAAELKKTSLTTTEYNQYGRWHSDTPIRLFKTWNNAISLAGLEVVKRVNIGDEELFENLMNIWTKLGRQPYISDMVKPFSKIDGSVYKRRFKSWRKALEEFVEYVNTEEKNQSIEVENTKVNQNHSTEAKHKTKRGVNWRLRFLVMRRDNFKCVIDGRSPATHNGTTLEVDHIIP
ncbi:MAG: homing endonuclease associated repeat-containing protein [Thermodesulfobacteriota bacterium]